VVAPRQGLSVTKVKREENLKKMFGKENGASSWMWRGKRGSTRKTTGKQEDEPQGKKAKHVPFSTNGETKTTDRKRGQEDSWAPEWGGGNKGGGNSRQSPYKRVYDGSDLIKKSSKWN